MKAQKPKDPVKVALGRIGAMKLHGLHDAKALTANAHSGFFKKFRDQAAAAAAARGEQVTDEELDRRAIYLRASHMQLLAYNREKARKKKAAASRDSSSGQAPEASANATDAA
ncbi:MAG TPA: hypothetical protein VGX27_02385 [Candidatus Dormibacteraeota bacterium]|nr:hypothetical protein [Candidatus Dormibacteraeota bacterium]